MKPLCQQCAFFLLFFFVIRLLTTAQVSPVLLLQKLDNYSSPRKLGIKQFYEKLGNQPAWLSEHGRLRRESLLKALKSAEVKGLNDQDYKAAVAAIEQTAIEGIPADSLLIDLSLTDAALQYFSGIAYGIQPALSYNGLEYVASCRDVPSLLAAHLLKNDLSALSDLLSTSPVIAALEKQLTWFKQLLSDSNYRDANLTSKNVDGKNAALIAKLYQLGIIATDRRHYPDSLLKVKLKEAQRRFNIVPDGILNSSTMQALNLPLRVRIQEIKLSINYYRWLSCMTRQQNVIVVNIPAAYLKVYRDGKPNLEMRVILGKTSTPTSTLSSRVTEVILYPYWHVPYSIATKELLPLVKRNPGYLNTGSYQVLNKSGNIVDPYSINWHSLSTAYFPYLIRQSTGCDNALGLLKLNFKSPFGIYLHDTPGKLLFKSNKRFFSHGCMRMEKPMELGHLVLRNNGIAIDTLEQKGCLRNQAPVTVKADDPMPVIVWYNPVDVDSTGRVVFFEDVYKKFVWRKRD